MTPEERRGFLPMCWRASRNQNELTHKSSDFSPFAAPCGAGGERELHRAAAIGCSTAHAEARHVDARPGLRLSGTLLDAFAFSARTNTQAVERSDDRSLTAHLMQFIGPSPPSGRPKQRCDAERSTPVLRRADFAGASLPGEAVHPDIASFALQPQPKLQRFQFFSAADQVRGAQLSHQQFAQVASGRLQPVARHQVQLRHTGPQRCFDALECRFLTSGGVSRGSGGVDA